jgi:hypothetical protein
MTWISTALNTLLPLSYLGICKTAMILVCFISHFSFTLVVSVVLWNTWFPSLPWSPWCPNCRTLNISPGLNSETYYWLDLFFDSPPFCVFCVCMCICCVYEKKIGRVSIVCLDFASWIFFHPFFMVLDYCDLILISGRNKLHLDFALFFSNNI